MLQWLLSAAAIAALLAGLGRESVPTLPGVHAPAVASPAVASPAVAAPTTFTPWVGGLALAALLSAAAGVVQLFGAADALSPWVAPSSGVAYANLRQRNHLATLLALGAVAWWWLLAQRSPEPSRVWRAPWRGHALLWLGWALLALAAAATGSRTGLLQWVFLAGFVALFPVAKPRAVDASPRASAPGLQALGRMRWATALGLMALYFAAVWALPLLLEWSGADTRGMALALSRLDDDEGCGSRLVLWSNVLHLIAQKPWLGWGWGVLDYAHFMTLYPGERFCAILDNAHNLPLHLAVTLGVPVALGVCFLLAVWVWRARPWREADPLRQMAWGLLAVIGIHSLLEYPLWYGPFQLVAVLCVLVLWGPGSFAARSKSRRWLGPALALGLCAIVAYVAFDYHRISQLYLLPEQRAKAYRTQTLAKAQASVLFRDQVDFAELTTSDLTRANAAHIHALATRSLHFSPEPKVVVLLLDSALLLGRDQEAVAILARFDAAFPKEAKAWRQRRGVLAQPG
jgi:O-antigen polymerase